jgi:hypothetical protein
LVHNRVSVYHIESFYRDNGMISLSWGDEMIKMLIYTK